MALVRCTCISRLERGELGPVLVVDIPDPECSYVVHRLCDAAPVEPTY